MIGVLKRRALEYCDVAESDRLVDIGCGDGLALAQLLARWPHLCGVGFDAPATLAVAGPALAQWRLGERLRLVPGDPLESVPSGADTYLLTCVLRTRDDADAALILRNVRSAAAPGTRVLILEPLLAAAVPMLALPDPDRGRARTEPELGELVAGAGLRLEYTLATSTPLTILAAAVPG